MDFVVQFNSIAEEQDRIKSILHKSDWQKISLFWPYYEGEILKIHTKISSNHNPSTIMIKANEIYGWNDWFFVLNVHNFLLNVQFIHWLKKVLWKYTYTFVFARKQLDKHPFVK